MCKRLQLDSVIRVFDLVVHIARDEERAALQLSYEAMLNIGSKHADIVPTVFALFKVKGRTSLAPRAAVYCKIFDSSLAPLFVLDRRQAD